MTLLIQAGPQWTLWARAGDSVPLGYLKTGTRPPCSLVCGPGVPSALHRPTAFVCFLPFQVCLACLHRSESQGGDSAGESPTMAGAMLVALHSAHLLTQAETRLLITPHRTHQDLGWSRSTSLPVSSLPFPYLSGSSRPDLLAVPQTFQEHSCLRAFAFDVCAPPEHSYFRPSSLCSNVSPTI